MRSLAGTMALLLIAAPPLVAQNISRIYSEPPMPSSAALDRLNLQVGWRQWIPTEARRDGISHVTFLPQALSPEKQICVQTRSGLVVLLDAASGAKIWEVQVGKPYKAAPPIGFNSKLIFVVNGVQLFGVDRTNGRSVWELSLPHAPAAAPIADEEHVYLAMGTGRLTCFKFQDPALFNVPAKDTLASGPSRTTQDLTARNVAMGKNTDGRSVFGVRGQVLQSISAVTSGGQRIRAISHLTGANLVGTSEGPVPSQIWDYLAESRLELTPLVTNELLLLGGYSGSFYAMNKFTGEPLYRFQAGPPLTANMGQHGDTAYVASQDYNIYALDILPGRILWRFVGGGPILQKPIVNDLNVFTVPENAGLHKLDRSTGTTIWSNLEAARFLAANKKYVYATDALNQLLTLDNTTGKTLGKMDVSRDFVVPIVNEHTDRLYLASNDGDLICLHDKDFPKPQLLKTIEKEKPVAGYTDDKKKPTPAPAPAAPARKPGSDGTP